MFYNGLSITPPLKTVIIPIAITYKMDNPVWGGLLIGLMF